MVTSNSASLDASLLAATPLLAAPHFGTLPECPVGAVRYITAADGIYVEARTRVLHARGRVAAAEWLPYGPIEPLLRYTVTGDVEQLLGDALAAAVTASPTEWAGLLMLQGDGLVVHQPPVICANGESISTRVAHVDPLDVLVDIHSHGVHRAYFSATDDRDDALSPCPTFVAMVIGTCNRPRPQLEMRLVIHGHAFSSDDLTVSERLHWCD